MKSATMRWIVYDLGIISMLGLYGIIQERIMSEPYSNNEFFRSSVFLVFCSRLVAILCAFGMMFTKGEDKLNKAPLWKYVAVSFSNVLATWCQYEALKYVSFPVQMLGKSFKMMPVMAWSIMIAGKRYGVKDWLIALGVSWGVTQFLLSGEIKSKHAAQDSSIYGLLLMLSFLFCDGFTSTMQEKLFKDHNTSKYNQMLYVNSGSALVSAGVLGLSGAAPSALVFCVRHPDFVGHAASLSTAAVAGQFFIYSQVKEFGALTLAATMSLRQLLSILASYAFYAHSITVLQLLGLVLVFVAIFYKSYDGFQSENNYAIEEPAKHNGPTTPVKLGHAAEAKEDAEELAELTAQPRPGSPETR